MSTHSPGRNVGQFAVSFPRPSLSSQLPWALGSGSSSTPPPVLPPLQPTTHILGIWCFDSRLKRGKDYIMERKFHATSCFPRGPGWGLGLYLQH